MVVKADSTPTDGLLEKLRSRPNIVRIKAVELPPRGA
jgi:hypothetical protein